MILPIWTRTDPYQTDVLSAFLCASAPLWLPACIPNRESYILFFVPLW